MLITNGRDMERCLNKKNILFIIALQSLLIGIFILGLINSDEILMSITSKNSTINSITVAVKNVTIILNGSTTTNYYNNVTSMSQRLVYKQRFDEHKETSTFGHTWEHEHLDLEGDKVIPKSIAIGLAITSNRMRWTKTLINETFPFFQSLLASFCKTNSEGYKYHFYIAFDKKDPYFSRRENLKHFNDVTYDYILQHCLKKSSYWIHFIECSHHGKPAWAQNDAMMEAYMSNMEYYYRVNDDSTFQSSGWTEAYIKTLESYQPPNLGVVGPDHTGGNTLILTYDFVHHTHIDIHGVYYPRIFTSWYADCWITKIYQPGRSTKLKKIKLIHTMSKGTRYNADMSLHKFKKQLIKTGKKAIQRYVTARSSRINATGDRVISMSLAGNDPRYTYGAIRNAQLLPVHFPGWTLRLYIPPKNTAYNSTHKVPIRIINKLKFLGVQLVRVDYETSKNVKPSLWKYLVIDENNTKLSYLLIRNTDKRLNERDSKLTSDWMKTERCCYCHGNLKEHKAMPLVDGLIGGKNPQLAKLMGTTINNILKKQASNRKMNENYFLANILWSKISKHVFCYDSLTLMRNIKNKSAFGIASLGYVYNQYDQIVDT